MGEVVANRHTSGVLVACCLALACGGLSVQCGGGDGSLASDAGAKDSVSGSDSRFDTSPPDASSTADARHADAHTGDVRGAVGKGPFVLGSTVTISPVSSMGTPTGEVFTTTTTDDVGDFNVLVGATGPVSIQASGFYFNEVTNALSLAPITLQAWATLSGTGDTVNVNTITHLAYGRIQTLINGGASVPSATTQAESELRVALGIGPASFNPGEPGISMNFAGGDTPANEYLVAVSSVIEQAAIIQAGTTGSIDAAVQELLDEVASDLAPSGTLPSILTTQLQQAEQALDTYATRDSLTARFTAEGISATVPNLDNVVDTDLDGIANATDNCRLVYNPAQQKVNSVCAYRRVSSLDSSFPTLRQLYPVALGDINDDGIVDVAFTADDGSAHVMAGFASPGFGLTGGGQYHASVIWGATGGPGPLLAEDVTGDGIADLVGGEDYYCPGHKTPPPVPGEVAIGGATFVANGFDVGDFNGDGLNDIVYAYTANYWLTGAPPTPVQPNNGVVVLLNDSADAGVGSFAPVGQGIASHGFAAFARRFLGASSPLGLVLVNTSEIDFVQGNGDGTFASPQVILGDVTGLADAAVGDFNGDGILDIGILLQDLMTIEVLPGDGLGHFFAPGTSDAGTLAGFSLVSSAPLPPGNLRAADMTGDGIDDVVDYDVNGSVHVLVSSGTGLGTEVVLTLQAVGYPPPVFAVGDVNADGTADIVAQNVSGMVSFLVFR
jgi:hypothetical protein